MRATVQFDITVSNPPSCFRPTPDMVRAFVLAMMKFTREETGGMVEFSPPQVSVEAGDDSHE